MGYFYTVVPLYSKALLEEQIAEKQISINKLSSELLNINSDIRNSKLELVRVKQEAEKTYSFAKSEALINIGEMLGSCAVFRLQKLPEISLVNLLNVITDTCLNEVTSNKYIFFALNTADRNEVLLSIKNVNVSFKVEAQPILNKYKSSYDVNLLMSNLQQVWFRQVNINFWSKYDYIWGSPT